MPKRSTPPAKRSKTSNNRTSHKGKSTGKTWSDYLSQVSTPSPENVCATSLHVYLYFFGGVLTESEATSRSQCQSQVRVAWGPQVPNSIKDTQFNAWDNQAARPLPAAQPPQRLSDRPAPHFEATSYLNLFNFLYSKHCTNSVVCRILFLLQRMLLILRYFKIWYLREHVQDWVQSFPRRGLVQQDTRR